MGFIDAKCPVCAREIQVPDDLDKPFCMYCGAQFLKDAACAFAGTLKTISASSTPSEPSDFTIVGTALLDYKGDAANVVIPDGISSIENEAFLGNRAIVNVEMPDSVTSIGWRAFDGCSSLKSVVFSKSLVSIESSAFQSCKSLTEVNLPRTVKEIGSSCFKKCSSMTVANIPSSATTGSYCFDDNPAKVVRI